MLIIPCADDGGFRKNFRYGLERFGLPLKEKSIISSAGEILFYSSISNEFASAVGYAISVDKHSSSGISPENLKKIFRKIMEKCDEEGWNIINIPLLGSGSGKVRALDAYRYMEEELGSPDCRLQIKLYIIDQGIYSQVKNYIDNNASCLNNSKIMITNNITNNFNGEYENIKIQQGTSNFSKCIQPEYDYVKVAKLIREIKEKLDNEEKDSELRNKINDVEMLLEKRESPSRIKIILNEAKNIATGVVGSLIAEALLP